MDVEPITHEGAADEGETGWGNSGGDESDDESMVGSPSEDRPPPPAERALRPLHTRWVLWFHGTKNNNWGRDSYAILSVTRHVEDVVGLRTFFADRPLEGMMLFYMREMRAGGRSQFVYPSWEDPNNARGGVVCFSMDPADGILAFWRLVVLVSGEHLYDPTAVPGPVLGSPGSDAVVNGVSIADKGDACKVKVWYSRLLPSPSSETPGEAAKRMTARWCRVARDAVSGADASYVVSHGVVRRKDSSRTSSATNKEYARIRADDRQDRIQHTARHDRRRRTSGRTSGRTSSGRTSHRTWGATMRSRRCGTTDGRRSSRREGVRPHGSPSVTREGDGSSRMPPSRRRGGPSSWNGRRPFGGQRPEQPHRRTDHRHHGTFGRDRLDRRNCRDHHDDRTHTTRRDGSGSRHSSRRSLLHYRPSQYQTHHNRSSYRSNRRVEPRRSVTERGSSEPSTRTADTTTGTATTNNTTTTTTSTADDEPVASADPFAHMRRRKK